MSIRKITCSTALAAAVLAIPTDLPARPADPARVERAVGLLTQLHPGGDVRYRYENGYLIREFASDFMDTAYRGHLADVAIERDPIVGERTGGTVVYTVPLRCLEGECITRTTTYHADGETEVTGVRVMGPDVATMADFRRAARALEYLKSVAAEDDF